MSMAARLGCRAILVVVFLIVPGLLPANTPAPGAVTPAQALARLREGNQRFRSSGAQHPNAGLDRVQHTHEHGQAPFAVILGCSDSRVPPEVLFDQGIGDLFVIRVAGNIADPGGLGSIEYAVEHLGSPLVVVLGHEACGAVTATAGGGEAHGHIATLIHELLPAVQEARRVHPHLDAAALVPFAVRANITLTIEEILRESAILRDAVRGGRVEIVGAVYDLANGEVTWTGAHPQQALLLKSGAGAAPAAAGHGGH